jgi:pteridine reductase
MRLPSTTALITGGAHRLGRLIALELAQAGATVIIHYHDSETQARATVAKLQAQGHTAHALQADLCDPAQVDRLFGAVAALGGARVLVNSAANLLAGDVLTLPLEAWQRALDLNLTAPFLCAQRAAQQMLAHPPADGPDAGVIINLADVAGLQPWAKYPAHSVSKAGLIRLTEVLAKALAPRIRVNAIAPGLALKPDDWPRAQWEALAARTLLKRAGSGYDVARAVRFLIEHDFITGETLVMDGGRRIA